MISRLEPEKRASPETPSEEAFGKHERIRHFHKICKLLSIEQQASDEVDRSGELRPPAGARPHALQKSLAALAAVGCFAIGMIAWQSLRGPLRQVDDYRWSADYRTRPAADALQDHHTRQLFLATGGDGVHAVDYRTRYFQQFTRASTSGGLLADDVEQLQHDLSGRIYFLCQQDRRHGLSRLDLQDSRWQTLLSMRAFDSLASATPPRLNDVVPIGERIWLATEGAGIGVYNRLTHDWEQVHTAAAGQLLDDRVRQLLLDPRGRLWIATAAGINLVESGRWLQFRDPKQMVSVDVRRLAWSDDGKLWYSTVGGGLGQFDGQRWITVRPVSQWEDFDQRDVRGVVQGDSHDQLWFLARDNRIGRYDAARHQWQSLPAPRAAIAIEQIVAAPTAGAPRILAATNAGAISLEAGPSPAWKPAGLDGLPLRSIDAGPHAWAAAAAEPNGPAALFAHSGQSDWKLLVGAHPLPLDRSGLRAAAAANDALYLGGSDGVARYELATHKWSPLAKSKVLPPHDNGDTLDLQVAGGQLWQLTGGSSIVRRGPGNAADKLLIGGEPLQATLSELTAVVSDAKGQLWVATPRGLATYDPLRRSWREVAGSPAGVLQLAAARDRVWALADGQAFDCSFAPPKALDQGKLRLARIVAAPELPEALALDVSGLVIELNGPTSNGLVVGNAAPGLDLSAADQVVALGDVLVVGGPRPHAYQGRSRNWIRLEVGPVKQLAVTDKRIWLLTTKGKLYSLDPSAWKLVDERVASTPLQLAAHGQTIVALLSDGRLLARHGQQAWTEITGRPAGPGPELLAGETVVALAVEQWLCLAGGPRSELWMFDWTAQQWSRATNAQQEPLAGITQLTATNQFICALAGESGQLFSATIGQSQFQAVLAQVSQVIATDEAATAVDRRGRLWLLADSGSKAFSLDVGIHRGGSAALRDVAAVNVSGPSMVVATSEGAALVPAGLAPWTPIAGSQLVNRIYPAPDDRSAWATTSTGRLYRLAKGNGGWSWQAAVNEDVDVKTFTAGAGPDGSHHWACLADGKVMRITPEGSEIWLDPTPTPESSANLVDVVPAADGFLAAFAGGTIGYYRAGAWAFKPFPAPQITGIRRLLYLGTAEAPKSYWLLADDGQLFVMAVSEPKWRKVADKVDSISTDHARVVAVQRAIGQVQAFDAHGRNHVWISSGSPAQPIGSAVAAMEFEADGRALLIQSDGKRTQGYDPHSRRWFEVPDSYVELVAAQQAAFGRTADGRCVQLSWTGSEIQASPIELGGQVVRLAASSDSSQVLALLEDGRLLTATKTGVRGRWIGPQLPTTVRAARLLAVAASGERLYAALSDRSLWAYDATLRGWQSVVHFGGQVTSVPRLSATARSLWVEALAGDRASLLWYDLQQAGKWQSRRIVDGLQYWQPAPGGVIARSATANGLQTAYYAEGAALGTPYPAPGVGPPASEVTAVRGTPAQPWLISSSGQLWSYAPEDRWWRQAALPQESASTVLLDGRIPAVVTDRNQLLIGKRDASMHAWEFTAAAQGISPGLADGDATCLAAANGEGARLWRQAGAPHATLAFSTAWKVANRLAALAASGNNLWAANAARDVSHYDLQRRRWQSLPPAPSEVSDLWHAGDRLYAVGTAGQLSILENQRWQAATAATQRAWNAGGQAWRIDDAGIARSGHEGDTAAPAATRGLVPRRVLATGGLLWLEAADGSLWCRSDRLQPLSQVIPPLADGDPSRRSKDDGLVTAGREGYFVRSRENAVWWLRFDRPQPVQIALPASFAIRQVRQSAGDLLLLGDRTAVEVIKTDARSVDKTADIARLSDAAEALPDNRLQDSGDWEIEPARDGHPAQLLLQVDGQRHVALLDTRVGRFQWDVARSGMAWGAQSLVVTGGGVELYGAGSATSVKQFLLPATDDQPLKLTAWALSPREAVIAASDGRRWSITRGEDGKLDSARLRPWAAEESPWRITREGNLPRLALKLNNRQPVPVQIDPLGRLDIDNLTSLAVCNGSVFLATPAGVFEHSADTLELRDMVLAGKYAVLADHASSRLIAYDSKSAQTLDDGKWLTEPLDAVNRAWQRRLTTDAAGQAAIRVPLQLGAAPTVNVEYRDGRLVCDTPSSNDASTCDQQFWYVGTELGVSVVGLRGNAVSMQSLPGGARSFCWDLTGSRPALLALAGDGSRWKWDGAKWSKSDADLDRVARRVVLAGSVRDVEMTAGGARLSSTTDSRRPLLVFELAHGGMTSDLVDDLTLTPQAIWKLTGETVERIALGGGAVAGTWTLASTDETGRFYHSAADQWLGYGSRAYRLSDTGEPKPVVLGPEDWRRGRLLWSGRAWQVDPAARPPIRFLIAGRPMPMELDQAGGFAWDRVQDALVAGGHLVAQTTAGIFLASLPEADGQVGLNDMTPTAMPENLAPNSLESFWVAPDGALWARGAAPRQWFALDMKNSTWRSAQLSDELQQVHNQLAQRGSTTWRRRDGTVQLLEKTATSETIAQTLNAEGHFASSAVSAVWDNNDSIWLLTAAGLRRLDPADLSLLGFQSELVPRDGGEFVRIGARWLLRLPGPTASRFYALEDGRWKPVEAGQFDRYRVVDWNHFRAWRTGNNFEFELRKDLERDEWLTVNYLPDEGSFDFQRAERAAASRATLHVESPRGIATWRRGPNGVEYAGIRGDLHHLQTLPDRASVAAAHGARQLERYTAGGWQASPRQSDAALTESTRWQVTRRPQTVEIRVRPGSLSARPLALAEAGDFAYRHVRQIAFAPDGSLWTLSADDLARYKAGPSIRWHPVQFTSAVVMAGGAGDSTHFAELFVWRGKLHARLGTRNFELDGSQAWQAVEAAAVAERAEEPWSDKSWTWTRRDGDVELQRHIGGKTLTSHWDATAGRFDNDSVSDLAVWNDHIWLATPSNLQKLTPTQEVVDWIALASRTRPRFGIWRRNTPRLVLAESPGAKTSSLVHDSVQGLRLGAELDAAQSRLVFGTTFHDGAWEFQLGQNPRIAWRGLPTNLDHGRFAQDRMNAMAIDRSQLWATTPAGLVRHRIATDSIEVEDALPLPEQGQAYDIVEVQPNRLRVMSREGMVFDWLEGERRWQSAPADAAADRLLIEQSLWRWRRDAAGRLAVDVLVADVPKVASPLVASGRMAWDEFDSYVVDGDDIWLAGSEGIVRRRASDGAMMRWYRQAARGKQSVELRGVVAIRRFDAQGRPLSSACADTERAAARLLALDAAGQAWQFDGPEPGQWRATAENPWLGLHGRFLVRNHVIEAEMASDQQIHLQYAGARSLDVTKGVPAVLSGGKFTADVVRDLAFWQGRMMMATDAGVSEVDGSGTYRGLWAALAAQHAADAQIFRACNRAQLCFALGDDGGWALEPGSQRWKPLSERDRHSVYDHVRHQDDFWSWSRRSGGLHVELFKADAQGPAWPLFIGGQFSFDVLRQFRVLGNELWASTPAGVIQFRRDDMRIEAIHRMAQDHASGESVSMHDVDEFPAGDELVCLGRGRRYVWYDGRWTRRQGGFRFAAELTLREGGYRWTISPASGSDGQAGGFLVRQFDPAGGLRTQSVLLPSVAATRLRKAFAIDGALWMCLDHGLYIYTPR